MSLDNEHVAAVQNAVRAVLKDPGSAQFGSGQLSAARDAKGTITVCGFVNARNSFGGFVGAQPFLVVVFESFGAAKKRSLRAEVGGIASNQFLSDALRSDCAANGSPLGHWQP